MMQARPVWPLDSALGDALADAVSEIGGVRWGLTPISPLCSLTPDDSRMRARFKTLAHNATAALVVAFPYYTGPCDGNIAHIGQSETDYVLVMRARLRRLRDMLTPILGESGTVLSNGYPLPIVAAAARAGVGVVGYHGLLIVPPYGSYVCLGALAYQDAERCLLPGHPETESESLVEEAQGLWCPGCDCFAGENTTHPHTDKPNKIHEVLRSAPLCARACPTGALSLSPPRRFDRSRCLAFLNQEEDGALSPEGADFLRRSPYVWGCDLCQRACPRNRAPKVQPLPEFLPNRRAEATLSLLEAGALDGRSPTRKGRGLLLRNLKLMEP